MERGFFIGFIGISFTFSMDTTPIGPQVVGQLRVTPTRFSATKRVELPSANKRYLSNDPGTVELK